MDKVQTVLSLATGDGTHFKLDQRFKSTKKKKSVQKLLFWRLSRPLRTPRSNASNHWSSACALAAGGAICNRKVHSQTLQQTLQCQTFTQSQGRSRLFFNVCVGMDYFISTDHISIFVLNQPVMFGSLPFKTSHLCRIPQTSVRGSVLKQSWGHRCQVIVCSRRERPQNNRRVQLGWQKHVQVSKQLK